MPLTRTAGSSYLLLIDCEADAQVDDEVYDVTNFLDEHPGGKKILQRVLGQDASKQFWKYHNEKVMAKWGTPLKIGSIGSSDNTPRSISKPAPPTNYSPPRPKPQPVSQTPTVSSDDKSATEIFGEVLTPVLYRVDSSSSHLPNRHGTRVSPRPTITSHTTVFENLCARTWKKTLSPTSLNGKKRNNSQKNCSNRSHKRGSSQQPCFLFLRRST